jgi:hypothetical protein
LSGQPNPGQATQAACLLLGHRLCQAAEAVPGAGFDLDEYHRVDDRVDGDHIQFAIATAPVACHDPQPETGQVIGRQPFAERSDFGSRQHRHVATLLEGADTDIRRAPIAAEQRPVIPSCVVIPNEPARRVDLPFNRH